MAKSDNRNYVTLKCTVCGEELRCTSNLNGKSSYRSPVNRLIARNINDFLFANP